MNATKPIAGNAGWRDCVDEACEGAAETSVVVLAGCASTGPPCVAPWLMMVSLRPPLA